MTDEERARRFWERFYALSLYQIDRPHESVTVPLVLELIAEARREAVLQSGEGADR